METYPSEILSPLFDNLVQEFFPNERIDEPITPDRVKLLRVFCGNVEQDTRKGSKEGATFGLVVPRDHPLTTIQAGALLRIERLIPLTAWNSVSAITPQ